MVRIRASFPAFGDGVVLGVVINYNLKLDLRTNLIIKNNHTLSYILISAFYIVLLIIEKGGSNNRLLEFYFLYLSNISLIDLSYGALSTPYSVTMPVMRELSVTSKAGL